KIDKISNYVELLGNFLVGVTSEIEQKIKEGASLSELEGELESLLRKVALPELNHLDEKKGEKSPSDVKQEEKDELIQLLMDDRSKYPLELKKAVKNLQQKEEDSFSLPPIPESVKINVSFNKSGKINQYEETQLPPIPTIERRRRRTQAKPKVEKIEQKTKRIRKGKERKETVVITLQAELKSPFKKQKNIEEKAKKEGSNQVLSLQAELHSFFDEGTGVKLDKTPEKERIKDETHDPLHVIAELQSTIGGKTKLKKAQIENRDELKEEKTGPLQLVSELKTALINGKDTSHLPEIVHYETIEEESEPETVKAEITLVFQGKGDFSHLAPIPIEIEEE
ncbi:MAG: hypothetical protein ACTSYA_08300, partial [Candidatus Kariarchaeaceae archaeon]